MNKQNSIIYFNKVAVFIVLLTGLFSTAGFAQRNVSYASQKTKTEVLADFDSVQQVLSYRKAVLERNVYIFFSSIEQHQFRVEILNQHICVKSLHLDQLNIRTPQNYQIQFIAFNTIPFKELPLHLLG